MKILYLGKRGIVAEILKKAAEQTKTDFRQSDNINKVDESGVIFADYEMLEELLERVDIDIQNIILLASSHDEIDEDIKCEVLRTPFLSSDAAAIIKNRYIQNSSEDEDESLGVDILDPKEIDIVKSFLQDVESDDMTYDEINELSDMDELEEDSEESMTLTPDELISLVNRLKVKKLRKILRGAKIELTITFPKDK